MRFLILFKVLLSLFRYILDVCFCLILLHFTSVAIISLICTALFTALGIPLSHAISIGASVFSFLCMVNKVFFLFFFLLSGSLHILNQLQLILNILFTANIFVRMMAPLVLADLVGRLVGKAIDLMQNIHLVHLNGYLYRLLQLSQVDVVVTNYFLADLIV